MELWSYALEPLWENAEFVFYRGRRDSDPRRIFVLAPLSKNPEQGAVKRLEHEYSLRNKCTVDIVGDDAGFCRALQRLLRAYGFGTLTFAFAQEFLHGSAPAGAV